MDLILAILYSIYIVNRLMKPIRKAVILAAWYGTRFLPATKSVPKEMFPILDKPIMQYVVEELVDAGVEQIVFVTSSRKKAIEDYFDTDFELEQRLEMAWKDEIKDQVSNVAHMAQFVYVRQKAPKWTGDAILLTKDIIGDEPFLVCFGDDFINAQPSRAKQLMQAYHNYGGVILAAIHSEKPEDAKKYWFAAGEEIVPGTIKVDTLIEKPGMENKPSNIAVVSGYVLPPTIFAALEQAAQEVQDSRELHYIDWINILKNTWKESVHAVTMQGWKYYDCGNVVEYLKTNIEIGLQRDDMKDELLAYLKKLIG